MSRARTCFVRCLMRRSKSSRFAACTCSLICSCDRPLKSAALLRLASTDSGVRHRAGTAICWGCLRVLPEKLQRLQGRVGNTIRPAMAVMLEEEALMTPGKRQTMLRLQPLA